MTSKSKSRSLYFTAPREVEVRDDELPDPSEGELLVASEVSAVSAGTELLLYRGDLAPGTRLDEVLPGLQGRLEYPLCYGYAVAGQVVGVGASVPAALRGRRVLAFEPHRSRFVARPENVVFVPEGTSPEAASLLPTVETAVNLVLDGRPLYGEKVLVVGQGVVGLAATALLSRFPLGALWTTDRWEYRRKLSLRLGAERSLAPEDLDEGDFDVVFELSGSPEALNVGISAAGFEGRVVVGSWYGEKRAPIDLGTHFHRGRLHILSSQVSRIGAPLLGRWTKERRMGAAIEALTTLPVEALVTHRVPFERAAEAYRLLDERPDSCLQVLLTYT